MEMLSVVDLMLSMGKESTLEEWGVITGEMGVNVAKMTGDVDKIQRGIDGGIISINLCSPIWSEHSFCSTHPFIVVCACPTESIVYNFFN